MGEYTSTVKLVADVSDAVEKLNKVKQILDSMKNAKIKVSFESKDLKDLNATIKDVSAALKDLNNDTGLSDVGNASKGVIKVQELQAAITGVQDSLKDISSKNKNSGLEGAIKQLDEANTSANELENTLSIIVNGNGNTQSSNNASKNLEKESKSIQKSSTSINKAVNGINNWIATDQIIKNTKEMETALKNYKDVQSDAYKGMEESFKTYKTVTDSIIDEADNGVKKLEADSENAKTYVQQYDEATTALKKFNTNLKTVKIDAKDTGFKTLAEQAKEADKEVKNAVQSIINTMGGNQWEKTAKNFEENLFPYQNFNSSALDEANTKLLAFKGICEDINESFGKIEAGADVGEVYKSLSAKLSDSEIVEYANQLNSLEKDIPSTTKSVIAELGDLAKVQDELNKGFSSRGGFSKSLDNMEKSLSNLKDLDLQPVSDALQQISDLQTDYSALSKNADRNGGLINLSELMNVEGWDFEDAKEYPKRITSIGKAVDELSRSLKGIDTTKIAGITNGEMAQELGKLENSISGMSDSYAKANLNDMAQDMKQLYSSAQGALGSGTAEGYAEAANYAERFTQKAQEANQAYRQFVSGAGATSSYGGGAGGGGGGGNIFMGGISNGSGGTGGGNWFSGFATDFTQSFNSFATYLNRFMGYNAVYREARQAAQEMVETVKEIDTAMNQLQIVTGASEKEMDTFFESSVSQAKDLGQSVTDVLDTIQVYSRLGYDLADSSELAEYTAILSNVADVDIEEATTGLTSVIKGFDMEVSDAEHVADVLIDIGQNYAVSASEILEAFTRSSAAFGATGTTFEEASAIIAAGVQYIILLTYASGLQIMQSNRTHLIARTS